MLDNSLDTVVSDRGHDISPSRRGLVRAGVWTAPAVVLAAAAPAAASTSFSTTMTGLLCLYYPGYPDPNQGPTYAQATTPSGLRHDTVSWTDHIQIQVWGGTPGAYVPQIMLYVTFTPDLAGQTSDLVAEPGHPSDLVFLAPTKAGDRVPDTLKYLYNPSAPPVYDGSGNFSVNLPGPFTLGNAGLRASGHYHVGLIVGGQPAMYYHWYVLNGGPPPPGL